MPNSTLYPLTFRPLLKSYLWGDRKLEARLGRALPEGPVAESWEISGHRHGETRIDRGALEGLTLGQAQDRLGAELLGERSRRALEQGRFPLLVKLLDAHRWLSVQVHPNDAYALERENDLGKTEMWVVLHAEPGAELILGFRQGVERASFESAARDGEIGRWLHRVAVSGGDVFYVPAGSIHALGPGLLVVEIQQNSDTTYRIHDWDRVDHDGRPRPLHLRRAFEVLDYSLVEPGAVAPRVATQGAWQLEELAHCAYFLTELLRTASGGSWTGACTGETFEIWGVLEGRAVLECAGTPPLELSSVSWTLLPASMGEYELRAAAGSRLLRITTPPSS